MWLSKEIGDEVVGYSTARHMPHRLWVACGNRMDALRGAMEIIGIVFIKALRGND